MPNYEYQCNKCDEEFELRRKRKDPSPVICPACGKDDNKRLISASSFHLKGGGWFDEGYGLKDTSTKKKAVKDSDKESSTESKTDKTETASADTSEKSSTPKKKTEKTKKSDE